MSGMGHNSNTIEGNWISISREMRDHHLVGFGQSVKPADPNKGAFSRAEAWMDLIMLARWKDGPEMNKGRKVEMKAGTFQGGYSWLASRWNWTLQMVRTFLGKLIGERMIDRVDEPEKPNKPRTNQVQVLSVCNYNKYQLVSELLEIQKQQASNKQATSEQQHLNKDIYLSSDTTYLQIDSPTEQITESSEPAKPPRKRRAPAAAPGESADRFEHFWKLYPRREGKGAALKSWCKLNIDQQRRAYAALRQQLDVLTAKARDSRGNFCPHPATWLNQGRFDDELSAAPSNGTGPGVNGSSYSANGTYVGVLL